VSSRVASHVRSNIVGYVALFVALSGTVYAADKVGSNDIKTGAVKSKQIGEDAVLSRDLKDGKAVKSSDVKDGSLAEADIAPGSLTGLSVSDGSLTLRDLGGGLEGETTVGTDLSIPAFECRFVQVLLNPAPPGFIGSLVIGNITDADGDASVPNSGVVLPTTVTETSQGGAFANVGICNARSGTLTVDQGAVIHWRAIPE
jgi:hypothetical protein